MALDVVANAADPFSAADFSKGILAF